MAYVTGRCPNCGGEVQLDESKEKGFCLHCGSPIQVREAVARLKVEHSGAVRLSGVATDDSLVDYGYSILEIQPIEADKQFRKALEINPRNWKAWKGCADVILQNKHQWINKPYIAFQSVDIKVENLSYMNDCYHLTEIQQPVQICSRLDNGGHTYTFAALLGSYVLTSSKGMPYKVLKKRTIMKEFWSDTLYSDSYYGAEKTHFNPLRHVLEKAIQFAPENEKGKIVALKNRFVDYPLELSKKLLDSLN